MKGKKTAVSVRVVIMCFLCFWMSVGQLLELCGNSTCPFPEFSRNCSVADPEFRIWNHLGGDVWLATSTICLFSISWIVFWLVLLLESLCLLSNLWWLTSVSGACCLATAGIGNNAVVLAVSGLSHAIPEWRRDVLSLEFGSQPGHFQFYWSVSRCWFWPCSIGLLLRGGGLFAALAPK